MLTQAELLERIWNDVIHAGANGASIRKAARGRDEQAPVLAQLLKKGATADELASLLAIDRRDRAFALLSLIEKEGVEPEAFEGIHESALLAPESPRAPAKAKRGVVVTELAGGQPVCFSPDGAWVLGALDARICSSRTGAERVTCKAPPNGCHAAWAPSGRFVALGNADGLVRFCDARTGARRGQLRLGEGVDLTGLRFSLDGESFWALDQGRALARYGVRDGKIRERVVVDGERISAFWPARSGWVGLTIPPAPTPGARVRSMPSTVVRWSRGFSRLARGPVLGDFPIFVDPRAPDAQAFAIRGERLLRISLEDGKPLVSAKLGDVREVIASPDGAVLCAISGEQGDFVFLEPDSLKVRRRYSEGWAVTAAFSPDGSRIALVTGDFVRIFETGALVSG